MDPRSDTAPAVTPLSSPCPKTMSQMVVKYERLKNQYAVLLKREVQVEREHQAAIEKMQAEREEIVDKFTDQLAEAQREAAGAASATEGLDKNTAPECDQTIMLEMFAQDKEKIKMLEAEVTELREKCERLKNGNISSNESAFGDDAGGDYQKVYAEFKEFQKEAAEALIERDETIERQNNEIPELRSQVKSLQKDKTDLEATVMQLRISVLKITPTGRKPLKHISPTMGVARLAARAATASPVLRDSNSISQHATPVRAAPESSPELPVIRISEASLLEGEEEPNTTEPGAAQPLNMEAILKAPIKTPSPRRLSPWSRVKGMTFYSTTKLTKTVRMRLRQSPLDVRHNHRTGSFHEAPPKSSRVKKVVVGKKRLSGVPKKRLQ